MRRRRDPHEQCDATIRALKKHISDLEEFQRQTVNKHRELLAALELFRRVLLTP